MKLHQILIPVLVVALSISIYSSIEYRNMALRAIDAGELCVSEFENYKQNIDESISEMAREVVIDQIKCLTPDEREIIFGKIDSLD